MTGGSGAVVPAGESGSDVSASSSYVAFQFREMADEEQRREMEARVAARMEEGFDEADSSGAESGDDGNSGGAGDDSERARSGGAASTSVVLTRVVKKKRALLPGPGRLIDDKTLVYEFGTSPTPGYLDKLRRDYSIPACVQIRALQPGESVTDPPDGWVAAFPKQFEAGLRFPLHPWVRRMMANLGLAPSQFGTNPLRILFGLYAVWDLCQFGELPYSVLVNLYSFRSNTNRYGGSVSFIPKKRLPRLVDCVPTSTPDYRNAPFYVGGCWECAPGVTYEGPPVPRDFRSISTFSFACFVFVVRRWLTFHLFGRCREAWSSIRGREALLGDLSGLPASL